MVTQYITEVIQPTEPNIFSSMRHPCNIIEMTIKPNRHVLGLLTLDKMQKYGNSYDKLLRVRSNLARVGISL